MRDRTEWGMDPIIDTNDDGKIDVFEEALGFMIFEEMLKEEREADKRFDTEPDDDEDEDEDSDPLYFPRKVSSRAPSSFVQSGAVSRAETAPEPEPAGDPFEEYKKCRREYRVQSLLTVVFTAFFIAALFGTAWVCYKASAIMAVVFGLAAAAALSVPLVNRLTSRSIAKAKYEKAKERWERFCGLGEDR